MKPALPITVAIAAAALITLAAPAWAESPRPDVVPRGNGGSDLDDRWHDRWVGRPGRSDAWGARRRRESERQQAGNRRRGRAGFTYDIPGRYEPPRTGSGGPNVPYPFLPVR